MPPPTEKGMKTCSATRAHRVDADLSPLRGSGDVVENQLVDPVLVVASRHVHRVTHVDVVPEPDSLGRPAVFHVKADDDPFLSMARPSARSQHPSQARKLEMSCRPTGPDFSGWNWNATRFGRARGDERLARIRSPPPRVRGPRAQDSRSGRNRTRSPGEGRRTRGGGPGEMHRVPPHVRDLQPRGARKAPHLPGKKPQALGVPLLGVAEDNLAADADSEHLPAGSVERSEALRPGPCAAARPWMRLLPHLRGRSA